ncbi:hypothetical protein AK812_SmicGene45295 [Symbiodinium microadriaticum]|uniref:Uncharacterized protein n=1 Tax=Symbiodinium microadriaticum TaxID=2951 RepID=A0A1Q9BWG2_SYMMI|nr:hypothetical protein AK812_SmicGene45295 [Symbiodinium microadriaticum]
MGGVNEFGIPRRKSGPVVLDEEEEDDDAAAAADDDDDDDDDSDGNEIVKSLLAERAWICVAFSLGQPEKTYAGSLSRVPSQQENVAPDSVRAKKNANFGQLPAPPFQGF